MTKSVVTSPAIANINVFGKAAAVAAVVVVDQTAATSSTQKIALMMNWFVANVPNRRSVPIRTNVFLLINVTKEIENRNSPVRSNGKSVAVQVMVLRDP